MKKHIGICYHPTTVGLVDDNKEYLKLLSSRLHKLERIPCFIYDDPQRAVHFLTQEYRSNPFINRCLASEEDDFADHVTVNFDMNAIHQEIYNPRRFSEITVLIIDYAMPAMNGLEVCRLIREKYPLMKIIMLTGEAGKDLAVEAFNENSIDKFILKSTSGLMDVLVENIKELQKKYFSDLSAMILNKTADFSRDTLTCLNDPLFIDFFQKLCEENYISEYYLMDNHGSFLLLDAKANPAWLAVANAEKMLSYYQLAQYDDAAECISTALKNKLMLPYFYNEADFDIRPAEWKNYLHPAQQLQGNEIYYYSYITDSAIYKMEKEKIISFKQYLSG